MIIEKFDAVKSLVGGAVSQLGDEAGTFIYHDDQTPPTEAEINAEVKRLQKIEDANAYKEERQMKYPPIGDQLDDLYHAGAFSVDMAAKLKKVKDDNPKG